MKKPLLKTGMRILATISCLALIQYFEYLRDRQDDYNSICGSMSVENERYCFLGAARTLSPFSNDVTAVSALLSEQSIPYLIEEPEVVEIWVPLDEEKRARELLSRTSQGIIYPRSPRPSHDRLVRILLMLAFVAPIGVVIWLFERWLKRKEREAIEQIHAEVQSEGEPSD